MKRKFSENKLNSIIKRNGSNEKLGYVSDSRLLFRVRQVRFNNKNFIHNNIHSFV